MPAAGTAGCACPVRACVPQGIAHPVRPLPAPQPDSSALTLARALGKRQQTQPWGAGLWVSIPAARQRRQPMRLVEQLGHEPLILSGLLEIFLFQRNTLAVGFGETACSNYSLS